jgi:hypothetical protein
MSGARRGAAVARTSAAVVLGVLTAAAATVVGIAAAPSADATTYRYWTYWSGERPGAASAWTFSSRGPATDVVKDGTVIGWRFAVTSQAGTTKPRQSPALATTCPDLADPITGRTRVALVVDYGTESDAPPGQTPPLSGSVRVECLTFPSTARVTGVTVLDEAGIAVRTENGLLCALDSYPRGECAPVVSTAPRPSASPSRTPTRTASATPSESTASRSAAPSSPSSARSSSPSASSSSSAAVAPTPSGSTDLPSASAAASAEETLPAVSGSPASAEQSSSSAAGFVGGALVVAGVGAAAWWTSRRRGVS